MKVIVLALPTTISSSTHSKAAMINAAPAGEPGHYWVMSSDPLRPSMTGVAHVFGPFAGLLINGGESLWVFLKDQRI